MSGRTHRSAPTQCGKRSGDNGKRRGKRTFPQRGGTEPAPYRGSGAGRATAGCAWGVASASQIPKRNLGRQSWSPRPTGATQVVPSEGPMWASAPTKRRESFINHPGQRRTAERLRQRVRGNGWESEQGSSPKGSSTSDNPSVSLRLTAPFAQGSLGDEGCGLPRRFAPRNDSPDPSSFRGGPTGRRGNPSFLRWTGVRTAVPRAWPPPTKFRSEIWGVGQVVGPYGRSAEALGIRPYGCSAGGAQQRRVGRVSGISWTPPPPVRRSGCCRGSRRGP